MARGNELSNRSAGGDVVQECGDRQREAPLRDLLDAHREEIRAVVIRHFGCAVSIFGSVARGDEHPGSDIDLLVELEPDARPSEILSIGVELEDLLGVSVDVVTLSMLRQGVRASVLDEMVPV